MGEDKVFEIEDEDNAMLISALAAQDEAKQGEIRQALFEKMQQQKSVFVAEQVGRNWTVIGGGSKGGIVVRKGEELTSPEYPVRLSTGSIIEELELIGDRVHYEKISGDGPDFGWVSVTVDGIKLLQAEGDNDRPELEDKVLNSEDKALELNVPASQARG